MQGSATRRPFDALAARCYTINFLPTTFATYLNEIFYLLQRFGIFFLFEKENACKRKANSGLRPETPRTPRRSTWLVLLSRQLGTFARKLASLKQYGLVRLALQAVPSHFSDNRSTAARLLEACSSRFIKSLALPFFVTCNDLQIITSRSNLRRCVESPHPTRTLRNKAAYAKG